MNEPFESIPGPTGADTREQAARPVIVLVGRPNVGKSTLFNRLTGGRQALVTAVPGTTRDRREADVDRYGYRFGLVDTGGMGFGLGLEFSREVELQVAEALRTADYVWVMLDAKEGFNPYDEELFRWVVRGGKPFRIVVNKVDSARRREGLGEFYALGSDRVLAVSAEHGLGVDELLGATAAELPGMRAPAEAAEEPPPSTGGGLRVAFVGRPNVGKSSLVNQALGRARMIVSEVAGTTREAVETSFQLYGRDYVLVDTAGIRRRARTHEHLEKLGVLHSLGSLNWVQVAVLVLDASDEVAGQDARIASYILEHRRAVVVALNKWDCIEGDPRRARAVEEEVRERLRFLEFARFVRTSATEGTGIQQVFREVEKAATQFRREIQTADLNRMVQAATVRFPPPSERGAPTRIFYGTQVGTEPPAFRFFTNHPKQIDEAYSRFFENQLRHHFGLEGTPVRIDWRGRRPDASDARTAPRSGGAPKRPGRSAGPTAVRQRSETAGPGKHGGSSRPPKRAEAAAPRERAGSAAPRKRTATTGSGKLGGAPGPRKRTEAAAPRERAGSTAPRKRAESDAPRKRAESDAPRKRAESDAPRKRAETPKPRKHAGQPGPRKRAGRTAPRKRAGSTAPRKRR